MTRRKKQLSSAMEVFRVIKNTFFVVIMIFLVLAISVTLIARITGGTPSLFGYSLFRVSSGSMEPTLEVGDVVLVRSCETWDLLEGDIITFNGKQGELKDKVVTHRIVKAPYKIGGEQYLVTKGDANQIQDPEINTNDVIGKMVIKVDLFKTIYDIFITPWGLLILIGLIILAFFNEIVIFVKSLFGAYDEEENESVEQIIERYRKDNLTDKANVPNENEPGVEPDDTESTDNSDGQSKE